MTLKKPVDLTPHLDAMLRYARSLSRGRADDAEDLVSEALMRAIEREASFRDGGNLRGWLLSILHNTFISERRRAASERRRVEAAAMLEPQEAPAGQEAHLRLAQVRDAFHRLSDDQRAVLHLVTIEGLSYEETAASLGIPVGTVMSRLGRAREALRRWEDGPREDRPALRIVGGSDASG